MPRTTGTNMTVAFGLLLAAAIAGTASGLRPYEPTRDNTIHSISAAANEFNSRVKRESRVTEDVLVSNLSSAFHLNNRYTNDD
jgi:hypothetical protein